MIYSIFTCTLWIYDILTTTNFSINIIYIEKIIIYSTAYKGGIPSFSLSNAVDCIVEKHLRYIFDELYTLEQSCYPKVMCTFSYLYAFPQKRMLLFIVLVMLLLYDILRVFTGGGSSGRRQNRWKWMADYAGSGGWVHTGDACTPSLYDSCELM